MKVYGERTAFAETLMIALDLSRTETIALSDLGQVKKIGIEERFGRRYHVELKMGWGTGDHQLYHLGYLGRRTISEGSMLYYGCGAGVNTSRIWPDSARHRYFGVWTQWLRQFTLASRFECADYRGPTILDYTGSYVLESRRFSLSNRYAHDLSSDYGLEVPVDLDGIEVDGAFGGAENLLRIAPRLEADFVSFRSSASVKFEYSTEYLLAEPGISYSKRNPVPGIGLDRMTLRIAYALVDEVGGRQQDFLVPDARFEFFGERMAIDAGRGYRVYDWVREFNENRLVGRIGDFPFSPSRVEKEKIRLGVGAGIPMWSLDSRLEFKRVERPFCWDPSTWNPLIFHERYPSDVSMLSLTVTQDFSYGWIGSRYLMASEELPYTYRLELWAGMKHRLGPIADLDWRYRFQTLPYEDLGNYSIFQLDAGIQREILKLFTARFEVNNIANEEYLLWPGLESGRHFLFSIHTRL